MDEVLVKARTRSLLEHFAGDHGRAVRDPEVGLSAARCLLLMIYRDDQRL